MARQKRLNRVQVVVEKMLVMDLIESQVLDDLLHVEKLDNKHAIFSKAFPDAFGNRVQFFKMKKHTGGVDHIEGLIERSREIQVKEGLKRFDSLVVCNGGCRPARFHSKHRVSQVLVVFQLGPIVGPDVQNGPGLAAAHKAIVYFMRDLQKVIVEGFVDT